jgi:RNA polymerase sigma factor (sigma-70 family)
VNALPVGTLPACPGGVRCLRLALPTDVPQVMPTTHRRPAVVPAGEETVAAIYDRHARLVERWARRLAGPRFDAEDLLHDIFLVVLRRQHEFRGDSKVTTWLFRITEQVVRWRRRNDSVRRLLWGRRQHELMEAQPSVPTPVDELERRDRMLRLYRALDRLPEKLRTPLILFEIEGISGEEIAALTGSAPSAIWVRLHRGRTRLAKILDEQVGDAP